MLTGADATALLGASPSRVVAFRYDRGWKQVPVQVDERKLVDYSAVRQGHQTGGRPFSQIAYADPGTFAGPDPDPAVDGDDEIAAMAMDAGEQAPIDARRPGHVAGTKVELRIDDPVGGGPTRFLYLFRSDGSLDPAAGADYVDYDFNLLSGDYKTTYAFNGVPNGDSTDNGPPGNPENSTVSSDYYSEHLGARWIGDALTIRAGGATGVDILDGDKAQVSYGCGRSELTFSRGGGGFIANIDGPVRAIRSYIGANSGTYTQRDHVYYQRAEVTTTYLRVHPGIATISQYLDYSAAANGMTYRNSAVPAGVTIDGVPDPALETNQSGPSLGPVLQWEQATGAQGTLTSVNRYVTDMPGIAVGSFYQDDLTPTYSQCVGYADTEAHGASGPALNNAGMNTDPTLPGFGTAYSFTGTRTIFFDGPGGDAAAAASHAARVDAPLEVSPGRKVPRKFVVLRAPRSMRADVGRTIELEVRVRNTSGAPIKKLELCGISDPHLLRVGRCVMVRNLDAKERAKAALAVELRKAAAGEKSVRLRVAAATEGYRPAKAEVQLKPKG